MDSLKGCPRWFSIRIGGKPLAVNAYYFLKHTGEEVGTMADSSKRQRDFDLESWDNVTESGVNSPAASSRAGYPDISYQGMMPHVEPPFPGSGKGFTNDEDVTIPMPNWCGECGWMVADRAQAPQGRWSQDHLWPVSWACKEWSWSLQVCQLHHRDVWPPCKEQKDHQLIPRVWILPISWCRVKYVQQSHGGGFKRELRKWDHRDLCAWIGRSCNEPAQYNME